MLSKSEIYRLVNDYIGVSGGYLGDFSYRTHEEFYPYYCDLDINPNDYPGTTREKFLHIFESSDALTQSKIVRGVLTKYPVSHATEDRDQRQRLYDEFQQIIARLEREVAERSGVQGAVKNIVFAANGPKPELILVDSLNNTIEIVKNAEYCLVYDSPIPESGLLWRDLVGWWANKTNATDNERIELQLYKRLAQSLTSEPEKLLFETYFKRFRRLLGEQLPALIPQVYLHYDPKVLKELQGNQRLPRQRMDFLLLFSNRDRVVIEVDGKQHYAEGERASPRLYADMVAADRKLRLDGYEIYRFSGYELYEEKGKQLITDFFQRLFERHKTALS